MTNELELVYANLKATQERCNELLLENRELKKRLDRQEERWMQLLRRDLLDADDKD